jgi:hypothetical protein
MTLVLTYIAWHWRLSMACGSSTLRKSVALFFEPLLDPFDPSGNHI